MLGMQAPNRGADAGPVGEEAMRIEWVNHSSFVFDHDGIRIISDPWLEGSAFMDGWSLLSPTVFSYEDFKNTTHIWFSHEHPDHFSPPNIQKIEPQIRSAIKVLFQRTEDRKVVTFCEALGFKDVIEMSPAQWYPLSDDLRVMVVPNGRDSWMAIQTKSRLILNLNDCGITAKRLQAIRQLVGNVDVLLIQFSYAQWEGNEQDVQAREQAARRKLAAISTAVEALSPRWVIPSASYVWFSHQENYYFNDSVNRIDHVHRFITDLGIEPLVLYPGEMWVIGEEHDSQLSVRKYLKDYTRVLESPKLKSSVKVNLTDIHEAANKYRARARGKLQLWELIFAGSMTVYLTDYEKAFTFSFLREMRETHKKADQCDITMSSEAWLYCLRFDWGFSSANVSGRFQQGRAGGKFAFGKIRYRSELLNDSRRRSFIQAVTDKTRAVVARYLPIASENR